MDHSGVHSPVTPKNSGLAWVLSFVIIGTGQLYTDQPQKAAILFFTAVGSGLVLGPLWLIGWLPLALYAAYDAYKGAERYNLASQTQGRADNEKAEAQAKLEAKTFVAQTFIDQIGKAQQLSKSGLLTDEEFAERKALTISILETKKPREAIDDFLLAIVPLIRSGALTADETKKIKTLVM